MDNKYTTREAFLNADPVPVKPLGEYWCTVGHQLQSINTLCNPVCVRKLLTRMGAVGHEMETYIPGKSSI